MDPSGDDALMGACLGDVGREWFVGFKILIALDQGPKAAADGGKFRASRAKFVPIPPRFAASHPA